MGAGGRLKIGKEVKESEREKLRNKADGVGEYKRKGRGSLQTGSALASKITGATRKITPAKLSQKEPGIEINDLSIESANQVAETSVKRSELGSVADPWHLPHENAPLPRS